MTKSASTRRLKSGCAIAATDRHFRKARNTIVGKAWRRIRQLRFHASTTERLGCRAAFYIPSSILAKCRSPPRDLSKLRLPSPWLGRQESVPQVAAELAKEIGLELRLLKNRENVWGSNSCCGLAKCWPSTVAGRGGYRLRTGVPAAMLIVGFSAASRNRNCVSRQ